MIENPNGDASSSRSLRFLRWLIPVVALLATAGYVALASSQDLYGFPLDDAWIHQTYARNLAKTGQLAYLPGQPSAGSTSPAWSFMLSVGYLLGIDYRLWAYLLGGLSLAATAWLAYRLALRLVPSTSSGQVPSTSSGQVPSTGPTPASRVTVALMAGFLCAVEWHMVWAAASGMETMLFTALSLALLDYYFGQMSERQPSRGPLSLQTERILVGSVGIGLLGGFLALTRPEGLGLAGLVIVALMIFPLESERSQVKTRLLAAGISLLSLGIVLVPYIAFNLRTSGAIFPNTLYAKQAEYQLQLSLPARFWRVLSPTLVGAQVLLLPGFCYAAYQLLSRRRWASTLPLVWWLAFLSAYALRLPVNYQHGRYSIPSIPLLVLYGILGTAQLLRPRSHRLLLRVISRALPVAVGLLAVVFWARGALAYRDDVGFIQGEMAATAHWVNAHTAPDATIAVHDIGAIGYLTDRSLLDLAGLISPEVIPFITDAERLAGWMVQHGATYAVFFPDFSPTYAQLAADARLKVEYCTDYAWTRSVGHQNMCVYRLSSEKQP